MSTPKHTLLATALAVVAMTVMSTFFVGCGNSKTKEYEKLVSEVAELAGEKVDRSAIEEFEKLSEEEQDAALDLLRGMLEIAREENE